MPISKNSVKNLDIMLLHRILSLICILCAALYVHAGAKRYIIEIKDHKFIPHIVTVPAGELIELEIKNMDSTVEEFESHTLKREKIVPSRGSIIVKLGPLKPGVYDFFGEFHMETAQGQLIVR